MDEIYAGKTVSVTELKREYAKIMHIAEQEQEPIAVLSNNKTEAYLLPADMYESRMDRLEDLEDMLTVLERKDDPSYPVNLEDL